MESIIHTAYVMAINCVFAIYPECILNIVAEFLNCLIVLVDHNRYAGIAIASISK